MSKGMALIALLMATPALAGCDLIDGTLKALDINDPVQNVVAQPTAYITYQPEPIVEPEPVAYVPPPLGCEPHRNWRYMILDCQDRQIGTYGD